MPTIRLLEHEYDDLRRILGMLPTTTTTRTVELVSDCCHPDTECQESHLASGDVDVETFSATGLGRGALADLTLRIGEIYDNARARAIVESMSVAPR